MSRRTQLTTKFVFSLMAQLMENFIFIYLGLSLFTERVLEYKPLFILITIIGICAARWCAVWPLAALINWFIRYRARRRGQESVAEEIPWNWKVMLFWAGLRGAVGVALAAGLSGPNGKALRATVLVVVVLTVIIFGGTTARMLEILNIRTGVVEEIDSDDEFDIEPVPNAAGAYARKNGAAFGHMPRSSANGFSRGGGGGIGLDDVDNRPRAGTASYVSGLGGRGGSPLYGPPELERRNSSRVRRDRNAAEQGLLVQDDGEVYVSDDENDDLDLPPSVRRTTTTPGGGGWTGGAGEEYPQSGHRTEQEGGGGGGGGRLGNLTARGAINQILNATSEDAGTLFNKLDENFLKPHLLLDPGGGSDRHHGGGHGRGHDRGGGGAGTGGV